MNGKSIILVIDLPGCDLSYSCRKNSIKEEVEVITRAGVQSTLQLSKAYFIKDKIGEEQTLRSRRTCFSCVSVHLSSCSPSAFLSPFRKLDVDNLLVFVIQIFRIQNEHKSLVESSPKFISKSKR